jgi:hypothetical protein
VYVYWLTWSVFKISGSPNFETVFLKLWLRLNEIPQNLILSNLEMNFTKVAFFKLKAYLQHMKARNLDGLFAPIAEACKLCSQQE